MSRRMCLSSSQRTLATCSASARPAFSRSPHVRAPAHALALLRRALASPRAACAWWAGELVRPGVLHATHGCAHGAPRARIRGFAFTRSSPSRNPHQSPRTARPLFDSAGTGFRCMSLKQCESSVSRLPSTRSILSLSHATVSLANVLNVAPGYVTHDLSRAPLRSWHEVAVALYQYLRSGAPRYALA